jgi:hypothetical protein
MSVVGFESPRLATVENGIDMDGQVDLAYPCRQLSCGGRAVLFRNQGNFDEEM